MRDRATNMTRNSTCKQALSPGLSSTPPKKRSKAAKVATVATAATVAKAAVALRPTVFYLRDMVAKDNKGDLINQQGVFRKVVKLSNGTLSNVEWEGFWVTIGPGDGEWRTDNGRKYVTPSSMSFKKMMTYTIQELDDQHPHPPQWWSDEHYPATLPPGKKVAGPEDGPLEEE